MSFGSSLYLLICNVNWLTTTFIYMFLFSHVASCYSVLSQNVSLTHLHAQPVYSKLVALKLKVLIL